MRTTRIVPLALLCSLPLTACNTPETEQVTESSDSLASEKPARFFPGDHNSIRRAEELSLKHVLEAQPELLSGVEEVWAKRVSIDESGGAHTRIMQTINNIPVFGGEAIVHLKADGSFHAMTDSFIRNISVNTKPRYADYQAVDLAVAESGGWGKVTGTPASDLQIVRAKGKDHLTYRVRIEQFEANATPAIPVVFVDAHSGEIVMKYNDLKTARNRNTYTANNGTSLPGTLRLSESSSPHPSDTVANQVHDRTAIVYNYYFQKFNRDSYNAAGAELRSTVHYSSNYVNAFWNGSQMVYGDGDGSTSGPLVTLDIVAHELTHAVTDSESDLIYQGESGALNEAMSDVFAAAIEAFADGAVSADTWKLAEDCWTPGTSGDALRYMNDPALAGDYDYYPTRYTGTQDNGGVHWNSGIANLAFYLLVQGGTHPRGKTTVQVPGIGMEKAAAIFYRANRDHLTSSSNFQAARNATATAASALGYPQSDIDAVHKAWDAVGVPGSPGGGGGGGGGTINNGQTLSNLSASTGTFTYYTLAVPAGATNLNVTISGGTGDADLYVRLGSQPTTTTYDCRPYKPGNNETCTFATPSVGTYHIGIRAYSSYSGLSLTASYSTGGGGGGTVTRYEQLNLSASAGQWLDYYVDVPAGESYLKATTSLGTGDADLFVRFNATPTETTNNCKSTGATNAETCNVNSPSAGRWYISLKAYTAFSGVKLVIEHD